MINARARSRCRAPQRWAHGAADASAGPIEAKAVPVPQRPRVHVREAGAEGFAETVVPRGVAYTFEQVLAFDAVNPRPKMDPAELPRSRA